MSKRSADIQITKDQMQNGSFNFTAGALDDSTEPSKTAPPDVMSGRKIAPLKRRAGRGAGARSTGGGASLPNVFAGAVSQGFTFGNGAAPSPPPAPAFGFGGPSAPAPSTSFGNGTNSGFSFGQQEQEQPKPNPFARLAPAAPTTVPFSAQSTAPAINGLFGTANGTNGATSTSSAPSFGGFGATANNDKPASSIGFTFGGANANPAPVAPAANFFGNPTNASTTFTFGAAAAPAPKEEPKPASTGFPFGQRAASTEPPAPNTTTPSFTFNAPAFGAAPTPSTSFGAAPTTSSSFGAVPTTSTSFGSGATESKPSGFTYGQAAEAKAPEPPSMSLFGNPPAAAAPPPQATGGFTFQQPPKEAPAANMSLFQNNKPAEPNKPRFGYVGKDDTKPMFNPPERKDETAKPLFGFGSNLATNDEPQKAMVGAPVTEKKDALIFGTAEPTEKKEEPKSSFGAAAPVAPVPAAGGFTFQPAVKPVLFSPKPTDTPAPLFGLFGATTGSKPVPPTTLAPAASSLFSVPTANSSNAPSTVRMRSPPLPADSQQWSVNQLTDYYNLFALRSLNHFFKEELSKQDIFADLTPLCDAYTSEVRKIKELISANQRYKFSESAPGNGVTGKRAGEDNDAGGGKRRALGEEPKVAFAPFKSTTSQTLSSVLGGGSAAQSSKSTEKVPPKHASIFDNPSPPLTTSTWGNPFKKADTSNLPDDPEPDDDDEQPKCSGSMFDRASPTKQDRPFNPSASNFPSTGDNTWSPEKGVKFSALPPSGGLFSGNSNKGGICGGINGTSSSSSSSSGFTFSAKSAGAVTPVTSASASESETGGGADDGEPSDAQPSKSGKDLSLQGPGEEDEDPVFQLPRSIIYDLSSTPIKTVGAGALRVLKNRVTGKSRILVRSDLGKVLLNVALKKDIKYQLHLSKCLKVPEFQADGSIKFFAAKVKADDLQKLLQTVEEVKA